ncbi:MAG: phytase, partial [Pseudomonadota bacterium]
VYDLAGNELSFFEGAGLNNVDLVNLPDGRVLVAASDRSDLATAHILLATLDTTTGTLTQIAREPVGAGEGYGICIGDATSGAGLLVFSAPKNGIIYRTELSGLDAPSGLMGSKTTVLTTVPTQPEGCVVDLRTNTLYIGEENAGIWAIDTATGEKQLVANIDNAMLVADVEGLAIAPEGADGGYLVASSQGDNAYAVYTLPGMERLGRFRIADGRFGAAEETDGIALDPRSFGPEFPSGLFVAQDGVNGTEAQNFKLVRWDETLKALKMPVSQ